MVENKLFGKANLKDGEVVDDSIDASQFMQMGKTIAVCFNPENYEDEVELQLGDYEIEVRDGKTYAVIKKPTYPKTYKECCECLGLSHCGLTIDLPFNYSSLFISLAQLYISRNAYWKIAGEEIGLDKSWEPDWENNYQKKWLINFYQGEINFCSGTNVQFVLAFPTEEMRDAFYENFKELIENCKELL